MLLHVGIPLSNNSLNTSILGFDVVAYFSTILMPFFLILFIFRPFEISNFNNSMSMLSEHTYSNISKSLIFL
ncbi:hypothetical protein pCPXV0265 [Cowpox virus]|nr:hypothetical protein pCPXV0265 [Cowpox virus]SNB49780.1 hypothetical protein pCPXV0265 [Cowpox virus]SNB49849.1 hypothetical protein pCPXV0265 [Cowpox virus]SNB51309.1 hypothetical protein pCPXV0265 [Cowpox virus]SNB56197.1 hypothetical protein pCPXV0265 [Cowpox virus]